LAEPDEIMVDVEDDQPVEEPAAES